MKYRKILALLLAAAAVLSLGGCSFFENLGGGSGASESVPEEIVPVDPNFPVTVYETEIKSKPEKVACASPAIAEYLYDMKLLESCAALCDYCAFGPVAEQYPSIGSVAIPDMDVIKEVAPDYILTFSQYEESALIELQQLDIEVLLLEKPESIAELEELYRNLALFFFGAEDGKTFGDAYVSEYEAMLSSLAYSGTKKNAALIRILDYTMITGESLAGEFFERAGFTNAAAEYSGYSFPEDKWDSFDPDILFVNSDIHIIDLEENDLYKKRAAVKSDSVFGVDIDALSLCSKRSVELMKNMLATAYSDYTGGEALSPAYPSKYKQ